MKYKTKAAEYYRSKVSTAERKRQEYMNHCMSGLWWGYIKNGI